MIDSALRSIDVNIEGIIAEVQSSSDATEGTLMRVASAVDGVSSELNLFIGDEGLSFVELLEGGLEKSATMKYIRQKTTDIHLTTAILQGIADAGLTGDYNPFVSVVFE